MKVKALFFDIGGVVVHADMDRWMLVGAGVMQSDPLAVRREVLARVGELEKGTVDTLSFWKQVGEALWRGGQGRPPLPEECRWLWRDTMKATARVDDAVINFCWDLNRRGFIVAALSNTIVDHVEVLTPLGAYTPFRPCILSCQVGMRKPEPAIFKLAIQRVKLKPGQCLLVDDREDNVAGARAVGMQAVLYESLPGLGRDLTRLGVL
ncbi:MAG: HAD family phosphatase [Candidatus Eremiobacterota bacterium]